LFVGEIMDAKVDHAIIGEDSKHPETMLVTIDFMRGGIKMLKKRYMLRAVAHCKGGC